MNGIPKYTRAMVAYPQLFDTTSSSKYDRLDIAFEDEDGEGIFAEFEITFHAMNRGRSAAKVSVFGDALDVLRDRRVQKFLAAWEDLQESPTNFSGVYPDDLIALLEAAGIGPSAEQVRKTEVAS